MSAVSNDADGLPVDQFGNNIPLSDDETTSIDLITTADEPQNIALISPQKKCETMSDKPRPWKRRRCLPSLPVNKPDTLVIKKLPDPKPTIYFPEELKALNGDNRCKHCYHTTCHDLIYGDYCGLQATNYAKSMKNGICHEIQFKMSFESNYTSSLKFHRYMSIGVIDKTRRYEMPQCMRDSSYRYALTVFQVQQEQARMERVFTADISTFSMRTEHYKFDDEKDCKRKAD